MKKSLFSKTLLASLLGVSAAQATTPATKEDPSQLYGSDSLAEIVQFAINTIGTINFNYVAVGSSYGQRQMEGGYTNTGEATCTPNASGTGNDGCQQIAPMSRQMNSAICDDDSTSPGITAESDLAEGLAVCDDKLVMTVDNNDVCGGDLGAGTTWQAKLKLLYTGCTSETGSACSAVARSSRCARPERSALINDWDQYLAGCAGGACTGGIRAAYRRDDASGTTQAFLGFLGLSDSAGLTSGRPAYRGGLACTATASTISETHPFCDGGQFEGFFNNPDTGAQGSGDPIRATCAAADDLCGRDGRLGVVRAIRSVPNDIADEQAFPRFQCTRGARGLVTVDLTACKICPDGTAPIGDSCWMPYYDGPGGRNYNCMSDRFNTSFSPNCGGSNPCDGRAPNYFTVTNAGAAVFASTGANRIMPQVAQYRQNMANLSIAAGAATGGEIGVLAGTSFVCTERDATRNIGCLTGNTTCTTGFAGREQATFPANDAVNTALTLNSQDPINPLSPTFPTYPMGRKLYINAIGGFDNLSTQCANDLTNESSTYCSDQVEMINWFRNPANAAAACIGGGYVPIYAPGTTTPTVSCVGASTAAGCGSTVNATWDATTFASRSECLAD